MTENRCKIWPEFAAKIVSETEVDPGVFTVIDSPRAGGSYMIDKESAEWCAYHNDEESLRVKARLTTRLIEQRSESRLPTVTRRLIDLSRQTPNIPDVSRAERLLCMLVNDANQGMNRGPMTVGEPELLAWSESVSLVELKTIFRLLKQLGYIETSGIMFHETGSGLQRVRELNENSDFLLRHHTLDTTQLLPITC